MSYADFVNDEESEISDDELEAVSGGTSIHYKCPNSATIGRITPIVIVLLCAGYLLAAFVRDPFVTLIQNLSLNLENKARQQSMLIALNSAKKVGALVLSAVCTLLLDESIIIYAMLLMAVAALINVILCFRVISHNIIKQDRYS